MSSNVRCFVHDGLDMAVVQVAQNYASNGVFMLRQPYIAREDIAVSGSAVSSGAPLSASSSTKILRLEADPGKVIAYEVSNRGRNGGTPVSADTSSPRFIGNVELPFGQGYVISLLEIS